MINDLNDISISIIIATCNREDVLWETVKKTFIALKGEKTEIIIVNDGHKALTIPAIFEDELKIFDNLKKGVSSARNYGAFKSKGQILFFIDDDMWINSEIIAWINDHLIQNKNTEAVYNINWEYPPSLEDRLKKNKIGRYILSSRYNTMWGRMKVQGAQPESGLYTYHAIASGSLLLSKEVFNKIGGYNEAISFQGEDVDLANRIHQLSIPIYCVFDTTLHHNHVDRLHLDGFLNRIGNGYHSQFMAEREGLISKSIHHYEGSNSYLFNAALSTEKIWVGLHKLLPENKLFEPVVNRLTGFLSGLEKFRQWKRVFIQSNN